MPTYYNENNLFAAQWLRELIGARLISEGEVDERSIEDVRPGDLAGFDQCHFFAGIGGWAYALALAGWADRPVWTGSCPCQPFSVAGKRGGFDDERHLWPVWMELIAECRPATVFGEQTSSPDGRTWLDVVRSDFELHGYAVGAADLCAASIGAPHIRQRLWFVADAAGVRRDRSSAVARSAGETEEEGRMLEPSGSGDVGRRLADSQSSGRQQGNKDGRRRVSGSEPENRGSRFTDGGEGRDGMADTDGWNPQERRSAAVREQRLQPQDRGARGAWAACDWLPCRDGKIRPVESKYIAVADGLSGKMGTDDHQEGEINAEAKIDRDGRDGMRDLREERLQAPRPPQGREPGEQRAFEPVDCLRLLPSSLALAQLHGDAATEKALFAVLETCQEAGILRDPSQQAEAAWASLGEEAQDRIRLEARARGLVRSIEFPLAQRLPGDVGRLRGYGNAIVPQVAAEFIGAYLDVSPTRGR